MGHISAIASKKTEYLEAAAEDAQAAARYDSSVKEIAVAEVDRRRLENPRDRTIFREVAHQYGVGEQSLRLWVKKKDAERLDNDSRTQISEAADPSEATSLDQMQTELQQLRRQIQKLRTENEVLKRAFVVFSSEWSGEK